jgi:CheY-like chemotaxis protein
MILDEHKELANSPHLTSLKFSAKYLLSLVNDILQINKIEENRLVLENLIFNVGDELNTVKNSLQFIANRNKNAILTEIDPAIPEFLIGDKLRLSQIFMNLISNALKFTTNGQVKIKANLVNVEGNTNFIKFVVSDNGIGIAKDDQAKIFDKFVQIERKEDDYQGTGLGLAIVSRLIDLFGSKIQLESTAGEGTTFTFTIGFEHNVAKADEIINNIEVDLTSSQIFKVLVVEDNKINQIVTRKIIEKNNYKCSVVDDGLEAIMLLQKKQFDVILMDINMPVINGFETTRRIRAMGIDTPVVALTAFDKEEIAEEAISSGMNDIIIKPFEPVKLFQIISGQINKKNAV